MISSMTQNTHKSIELIPVTVLPQMITPREKYTIRFEIEVLVALINVNMNEVIVLCYLLLKRPHLPDINRMPYDKSESKPCCPLKSAQIVNTEKSSKSKLLHCTF
jgi:hypothetical protein